LAKASEEAPFNPIIPRWDSHLGIAGLGGVTGIAGIR